MTEKNEKRTSGIQRYFITSHRTSAVHIIPFDHLIQADHVVRIADLSVVGVGIESKNPIEPGLACFEEPVGGHKFGIVTWCKQQGDGYRAGISFVKLPHEKEQYILDQVRISMSHKLLRDPDKIIESLLKTIKQQDTNG
ncbi:MAG: hypothetical protein A2010_05000 [Nitrospirae bacterium GWD2_57_9]|nr:MAG: hypothetical protein A2010_05000 [Nitrospirae bacterium GWD2_57_9]